MGIKSQKEKFNHYKNIYNSLKFYYGKDTFRISGSISSFEDMESLSRIVYKKFEELLYTKKFLDRMHEHAVLKVLKLNKISNKKFFQILKEKEFNYESINILIIKIFDYVYYTIRKKLPYSKKLGIISRTITELLSNTFQYTPGEFCITAGIMKEDRKVMIRYENKYDRSDDQAKRNVAKLKLVIEEVNAIELSKDTLIDLNKRLELENSKEPYPGLLKIKMQAGTNILFSENSAFFGNEGFSLSFSVPIEFMPENEIYSEFNKLIKKKIG